MWVPLLLACLFMNSSGDTRKRHRDQSDRAKKVSFEKKKIKDGTARREESIKKKQQKVRFDGDC